MNQTDTPPPITDAMVRAAAEAMEDECLTRRGHDLGTIHRDTIARAALEAAAHHAPAAARIRDLTAERDTARALATQDHEHRAEERARVERIVKDARWRAAKADVTIARVRALADDMRNWACRDGSYLRAADAIRHALDLNTEETR